MEPKSEKIRTISILRYGAVFAILLLFLKTIEYRFFIKSLSIDIYLGGIALVFTLLGIWVASKILPNPHTNQYKLEHVVTPKGLSILSERELEVLKKMADGLSNQQIAESLFISLHTVKTHSTRIFEKLDVNRRTQAVLKAREKGILDEVISSKRV